MRKFKSSSRIAGLCGAAAVAGLLFAGCASSPGGIEPVHVSANKYARYSCASLRARGKQISNEALRLAGKVQKRSTNDAVAVGVALVVFWPAAFFVKGDGPDAEEYAKLVGERQAIEEASRQKGCRISFEPLQAANAKDGSSDAPDPNRGHVIQ